MTPEGTRSAEQFHASMAESSHLAARAHQELARAYTMAAAAHETYRGRLAAQELAEVVAPRPPATPRQDARPLPDYMQSSAPPLEAAVPWLQFFKDLDITSIQAAKMIRDALPDALQPTEAEAATWPTDPDLELVAVAAKLTTLPPERTVAAQDLLLRLWRKKAAR